MEIFLPKIPIVVHPSIARIAQSDKIFGLTIFLVIVNVMNTKFYFGTAKKTGFMIPDSDVSFVFNVFPFRTIFLEGKTALPLWMKWAVNVVAFPFCFAIITTETHSPKIGRMPCD